MVVYGQTLIQLFELEIELCMNVLVDMYHYHLTSSELSKFTDTEQIFRAVVAVQRSAVPQ